MVLSSVSDILRPLHEQPCQAYLSNLLQVADVLRWILSQSGPADIRMSSFSSIWKTTNDAASAYS